MGHLTALCSKRSKTVKYLMECEATDLDRGFTSAAGLGYLDVVRYLVEHGVAHLPVVKYLVEHRSCNSGAG